MTGKRYGTDDDVIFRTKHVKLKSMGKFNKRCLLQDGYAEHVQTCHIFHRQNFIVLSLRFLCEAQNFSATPRILQHLHLQHYSRYYSIFLVCYFLVLLDVNVSK